MPVMMMTRRATTTTQLEINTFDLFTTRKESKMKDDKTLILKERWVTAATDPPNATALEMVELTKDNYIHNPFPISLDGQKRLLELIYSRRSGIITRQELIDVLFNQENTKTGTLFRRTL